MLKILQARLWHVQVGFRKDRGTREKIANICWIIEKERELHENIYFCFIGYAKIFDYVDYNKLWKILKEMGIWCHLTCLLRKLCADQEETISNRKWNNRLDSKLGKEYVKAVYCHPAYLTSMQSISCEMPGWMNYKLESRFPGEISTISEMQLIPV